MANRYGEAALIAARMETYGKALTPAARWQEATKKLYPTSPSAQRKGGPRFAFLSLCEAGLVKGIPAGQYAPSNKSKAYALRAVGLLNAGAHKSVNALWSEVTDGEDIAHNSLCEHRQLTLRSSWLSLSRPVPVQFDPMTIRIVEGKVPRLLPRPGSVERHSALTRRRKSSSRVGYTIARWHKPVGPAAGAVAPCTRVFIPRGDGSTC
jgi:hypothetical protein